MRHTFVLPLEPDLQAELSIKWPMTEAQWSQMMIVLEAMRPALVRDLIGGTDEQLREITR